MENAICRLMRYPCQMTTSAAIRPTTRAAKTRRGLPRTAVHRDNQRHERNESGEAEDGVDDVSARHAELLVQPDFF